MRYRFGEEMQKYKYRCKVDLMRNDAMESDGLESDQNANMLRSTYERIQK